MHSEHKPTCVVVGEAFTMYHLDIDRLDEFKVDTKKNSVSNFHSLIITGLKVFQKKVFSISTKLTNIHFILMTNIFIFLVKKI